MTIANLRSWLATAKPNWTLPLARPEVEALLAERDGLVAAARAAIAYDEAIQSCADEPEKMASFCSAQGDDLDALYSAWMTLARDALAKVDA